MTHIKKRRRSPDKKHPHCRILKQPPVAVGDELEVNITDLNPSGEGTTRIQGYEIHVHGAKPRNCVKVKIIEVDEKAAKAKIIM
ncbi:MAG: TRAM domain-containing protein [Betaproteobacteria bacterium]